MNLQSAWLETWYQCECVYLLSNDDVSLGKVLHVKCAPLHSGEKISAWQDRDDYPFDKFPVLKTVAGLLPGELK